MPPPPIVEPVERQNLRLFSSSGFFFLFKKNVILYVVLKNPKSVHFSDHNFWLVKKIWPLADLYNLLQTDNIEK